MTRRSPTCARIFALILGGVVWLAGSTATAQVSPMTPVPGIRLGGTAGGIVDPQAQITFPILMVGGGPAPAGVPVTIMLGGCFAAPFDLHVCAVQPFPGLSAWVCPAATALTVPGGTVTFRLTGFATALPGNSPGLVAPCAMVVAGGVVINGGLPVRVSAYDLNGAGGVTAADLGLFLATLFASPAGYRMRADYNGDGLVNSADLARFLAAQFGAGSVVSCGFPACF